MLTTHRESSPIGGSDSKQYLGFTKLHGLGNDFVVVSEEDVAKIPGGDVLLANWEKAAPVLAKYVCSRNFGIGADGLILVRAPQRDGFDFSWVYHNADGSPSDMCGNGLRCAALFAVEKGIVNRRDFNVDTPAGPVKVKFDNAERIMTELGKPRFGSNQIPVTGKVREHVLKETLNIGGKRLTITCLSMGNPHCVIFDSGLSRTQMEALAPQIQANEFFPQGVNVEFVEVYEPSECDVFVWERGNGPTLACASGAAAVLVAGVMEGRLTRTANIGLPGGTLEVSWNERDSKVSITGPATKVFVGAVNLSPILQEALSK